MVVYEVLARSVHRLGWMLADRILMSIREAKKRRARSKLQKIALHSVERNTFQAAVPALVSEVAIAKAATEAPKHLKRILFQKLQSLSGCGAHCLEGRCMGANQ